MCVMLCFMYLVTETKPQLHLLGLLWRLHACSWMFDSADPLHLQISVCVLDCSYSTGAMCCCMLCEVAHLLF
jgi:hypothetical protein